LGHEKRGFLRGSRAEKKEPQNLNTMTDPEHHFFCISIYLFNQAYNGVCNSIKKVTEPHEKIGDKMRPSGNETDAKTPREYVCRGGFGGGA